LKVKIPVSKSLFRGVLSRFLGSAVVLAGFYLLWLGFVEGNALKAVPGALLIPAGLYLMVSSRRTEIRRESNQTAVASNDPDPDPQP
jgi:hypothetical protein